jgi:hypothetical protein
MDDLGISRRMGFCRQWSNDMSRFEPVTNSPYEYAD